MKILDLVLENVNIAAKELFGLEICELDFPPKIELGDFCASAFSIAKEIKKNPNEIAKELAEKLKSCDIFENVEVMGAYINIKVKSSILFKDYVDTKDNKNNDKKVMVEYLSPNTNKPLHLGHLRNGVIGMAVSNILEKNGFGVIKANLINDRGVHICKSMLAWQKWGNGDTPKSTGMKGDHFVGMWYVKFALEVQNNPELENEVLEMLNKWEENDPEVRKLWEMMNEWVYEGFEKTYDSYGFEFDKIYKESETYKFGKEIVNEGLKKGIFYTEENGAIACELPKSFGKDQGGKSKKATLQRSDGTSLYLTQDLGTAKLKFDEFKLNQSIYVVGSEQNHHFDVLFTILQKLGYDWGKDCHHLSYGMVYLPEGKMKSREGTVVDADNLLEEVKKLAKDEITSRAGENVIDKKELEMRAQKIALAAIKFYLLKTNPKNDIYFSPEESISFDGFTGPYCLYAYARATKILVKSGGAKKVNPETADLSILGNDEERLIMQKIINFNRAIILGGEMLDPSMIAKSIYELAVAFNSFYQKHSVINAEGDLKDARLKLVEMFQEELKTGLAILGIDVLEEM